MCVFAFGCCNSCGSSQITTFDSSPIWHRKALIICQFILKQSECTTKGIGMDLWSAGFLKLPFYCSCFLLVFRDRHACTHRRITWRYAGISRLLILFQFCVTPFLLVIWKFWFDLVYKCDADIHSIIILCYFEMHSWILRPWSFHCSFVSLWL